jgi:prevent-host-death family protein
LFASDTQPIVCVVGHDSNLKGNVAELAFAAEAARLGLSVLKPMTEHERYDLVLGMPGGLFRVQCKWAKREGDVVAVNLATSRRTTEGYLRTTYSSSEIDAIGAYCDDLNACFLIPIDRVDGQHALRLRLAPARNGQRAALHFADEYRLGAVAQLEERRHGMAEVRGSSPLSSTEAADAADSQCDADPPAPEVVGAHRFRNHFGYYLERASQGTEVLVERRGKPYARLCPPG